MKKRNVHIKKLEGSTLPGHNASEWSAASEKGPGDLKNHAVDGMTVETARVRTS